MLISPKWILTQKLLKSIWLQLLKAKKLSTLTDLQARHKQEEKSNRHSGKAPGYTTPYTAEPSAKRVGGVGSRFFLVLCI